MSTVSWVVAAKRVGLHGGVPPLPLGEEDGDGDGGEDADDDDDDEQLDESEAAVVLRPWWSMSAHEEPSDDDAAALGRSPMTPEVSASRQDIGSPRRANLPAASRGEVRRATGYLMRSKTLKIGM
jgi:hypothetical protein